MLQFVCERKGASEYATSWLVSLLRRLGVIAKRRNKVMDQPINRSSQTATLLVAPFVDLVLRECPVGEHAINGVAESAVREVKSQTRTLKFALEAHVGKIVESHSILRWIPMMASDAISFFRRRDGLTVEMRRYRNSLQSLESLSAISQR